MRKTWVYGLRITLVATLTGLVMVELIQASSQSPVRETTGRGTFLCLALLLLLASFLLRTKENQSY